MATTETLEQALRLLIEDTKRYRQRTEEDTKQYRQRADVRFERIEQTMAESAARFDQARAESAARLDQAMAKTQMELDALSKEVKETAKQVKATTKQMGELSNRMGTLVEDIVSPDMLRVLRQVAHIPEEIEGIINVRQREFYNGKDLNGHPSVMEFDAIARCGDYALVNETKTTLRPEQVKEFLAKLAMARDYFPQLVGKQIIGAIASLRIEPSLIKHASNQGLLVLALGEGMLQLKNEADFQPKIF